MKTDKKRRSSKKADMIIKSFGNHPESNGNDSFRILNLGKNSE